jgi:hypothetical protein
MIRAKVFINASLNSTLETEAAPVQEEVKEEEAPVVEEKKPAKKKAPVQVEVVDRTMEECTEILRKVAAHYKSAEKAKALVAEWAGAPTLKEATQGGLNVLYTKCEEALND